LYEKTKLLVNEKSNKIKAKNRENKALVEEIKSLKE